MVARLFAWCAMALAMVTGALYAGYRGLRRLHWYQRWLMKLEGKKNARLLRLKMDILRCEVCGCPVGTNRGDIYDSKREAWWCQRCAKKVLINDG
jgi:hypothetical protein